ncbi:MAG: sorbosone dehydrogenase family protein, partial [Mycobacteriales bacterium]
MLALTRRWLLSVAALLPALLLLGLLETNANAGDPRQIQVSFARIGSGLVSPVTIGNAFDNSGRLFILEQAGRVRVYRAGRIASTPYIDIRSRVLSGGERGLLGIAFHRDFAHHPYVYLYYTAQPDGRLRLSRFKASTAGASTVSASTEVVFMEVPHPNYANHNGGQLMTGRDGYLYIGTGDGGGGGDPPGNAQNRTSLLGKILRIDVSRACAPRRYCIPASNPFATSTTARREILHYGLRNPWRFSADRVDQSLWIGDVGQSDREEVDHVAVNAVGRNFGWDCREGNLDTTAQYGGTYCAARTFAVPVQEYDHSLGCS